MRQEQDPASLSTPNTPLQRHCLCQYSCISFFSANSALSSPSSLLHQTRDLVNHIQQEHNPLCQSPASLRGCSGNGWASLECMPLTRVNHSLFPCHQSHQAPGRQQHTLTCPSLHIEPANTPRGVLVLVSGHGQAAGGGLWLSTQRLGLPSAVRDSCVLPGGWERVSSPSVSVPGKVFHPSSSHCICCLPSFGLNVTVI